MGRNPITIIDLHDSGWALIQTYPANAISPTHFYVTVQSLNDVGFPIPEGGDLPAIDARKLLGMHDSASVRVTGHPWGGFPAMLRGRGWHRLGRIAAQPRIIKGGLQ